jgi:hypothetical protein
MSYRATRRRQTRGASGSPCWHDDGRISWTLPTFAENLEMRTAPDIRTWLAAYRRDVQRMRRRGLFAYFTIAPNQANWFPRTPKIAEAAD